MANYNSIRTAEAQPIGTAVPWVGGLTSIPAGWLPCNGQSLEAADYPLLARVIQNAYGGNFTGSFPTYTGDFRLPQVSQKGLADISLEYFTDNITSPGGDQPTLGIDTLANSSKVAIYVGPEGDVGVPGIENAITDLNFTYTPDPDGTVELAALDPDNASVAATTLIPQFYSEVAAQPNANQVPPSLGNGATFNVIQNTDNTYSIVRRNKGENYSEDDRLVIAGSLIGGVNGVNDLFIQVVRTGNPFFSGEINGGDNEPLDWLRGNGSFTLNVFPRKLGRNHFPSHFHPGQYETLDTGSAASIRPGRGVGVWDNPEIILQEGWAREQDGSDLFGNPIFDSNEPDRLESGNVWGDSLNTGVVDTVTNPFTTGLGEYSVGIIRGTLPPRTHTPINTAPSGHGIGKPWFTSAKKLRNALDQQTPGNNALEVLRTTGQFNLNTRMPFSDAATPVGFINYDTGPSSVGGQLNDINIGSDLPAPFTNTSFNHAGNSFTRTTPETTLINDVIEAHDHGGDIVIQFNNGSLTIPPNIQTSAVPNVVPSNSPSTFRITFDTRSPCLSVLTLIRAY